MLHILRSVIALILTGSVTFSLAGGPAIGVAIASGSFQINDADVKGNATLFEGSNVKTSYVSSRLRMKNGASIELGSSSEARVFANRTVLESGSGQIDGPSSYSLEARKLSVAPSGGKAIARVQMDGQHAILVEAINGPVRVATAKGILIARVTPGRALRFIPGADDDETAEINGCVLRKGGQYIIADLATGQVYHLKVPLGGDQKPVLDLAPLEGNRVVIKGRIIKDAPAADGTPTIEALSASQVRTSGCIALADQVKADPQPGSTTNVGKVEKPASGSNKGLIIAGVLIAAGAGVGVALAAGSKSKSQ